MTVGDDRGEAGEREDLAARGVSCHLEQAGRVGTVFTAFSTPPAELAPPGARPL